MSIFRLFDGADVSGEVVFDSLLVLMDLRGSDGDSAGVNQFLPLFPCVYRVIHFQFILRIGGLPRVTEQCYSNIYRRFLHGERWTALKLNGTGCVEYIAYWVILTGTWTGGRRFRVATGVRSALLCASGGG